jgi:hypothetical protein
MKEYDVDKTCSTHRGGEKWIHSFSQETLREETPLGDLGIYGKIA